jgi:hypothetical protein
MEVKFVMYHSHSLMVISKSISAIPPFLISINEEVSKKQLADSTEIHEIPSLLVIRTLITIKLTGDYWCF